MNPLTQQGMAALKSGNKAEARRLLKQALQQDPKDTQAWLCLSGAVEGDADTAYCLNMVLRLDPNNKIAREGMARFSQPVRPATTSPSSTEPRPAEPPAQPDFRAQLLNPATFRPAEPEKAEPPSPASERPIARPAREEPQKPQPKPARKSQSTRPAAARKAPRRKTKKSGFAPWMWLILGGMGMIICLTLVAFVTVLQNNPNNPTPTQVSPVSIVKASQEAQQPAVTLTRAIPPTSTEIANPTATSRPTQTPMPTATYIIPGPLVENQMADIRQQVSAIRELPIQREVPGFLVTKNQASDLLRGLYITEGTKVELENEKRSLAILGLINPSYDLVHAALNQFVDNIGGFYLPSQKQMYILGIMHFGGVEHTVYSHEFDHALVDQSFDISKLQDCPADAQRCEANRALVEGDATLLMNQWLKQAASKEDHDNFLYYQPPTMVLSNEAPPDYLVEDFKFPYTYGLKFVEALYKRGKWQAVNDAYANPPASTEQILHPEKYIAGEGPIPVFAPAVENALGGDWQITANSTLGEWSTYLLLTSGADEAARIDVKTAAKAAAGWGGDHYQAYYSPSLDKSALAVWWAWDSEKEGKEFNAALEKHLNFLYNGAAKEQAGADCWENNGQTTCVIIRPGQTLWLTAPDLPTIITMWGAYADFQPQQ